MIKGNGNVNYRHGLAHSRFWVTWRNMKARCANPTCQMFPHYGGRGITVCKEWNNFINFKRDMYKTYLQHCKKFGEVDTQIERRNNNGNYEKSNCSWATRLEQGRNKSNRRFVTVGGVTKELAEWLKEFKMTTARFYQRTMRDGLTEEQAFLLPMRKYPR